MIKNLPKKIFFLGVFLFILCHAIIILAHKNYLPLFGSLLTQIHNQVIRGLSIEFLVILSFVSVALLIKNPSTILIRLVIAALVFFVGLFIYRTTAFLLNYHVKPMGDLVYFPELANAFLNKRLFLQNPSTIRDLTFFNGKWYLAFPPLGAILMLPSVAIGGIANVNPISFSTLWGAFAIATFWLGLDGLRRKGIIGISIGNTFWLTALLGFGSAFFHVTIASQVWFISNVLAVAFCCLAFWLAVDIDSPIFASSALAIGMLARPTIGISALFLLGIIITKKLEMKQDIRKLIFTGLKMAIPLGLVVIILLTYNYLRFNNWFEFGYSTMNVGNSLKGNLATYGQFNIHYFGNNLFYTFLALPSYKADCLFLTPSSIGMSLFITMPVLILFIFTRSKKIWSIGAYLTILFSLISILLYFSTGAPQFGSRYSLDYIVPLIAVLGTVEESKRIKWFFRGLIFLGIFINIIGVWWFFGNRC